MVQPDRPQMTIYYGTCALHAEMEGYKHATRICNTDISCLVRYMTLKYSNMTLYDP